MLNVRSARGASRRVVVINGDVLLKQGARIEGDLVVVGGVIEGQKDAIIEGAVRWYRQALAYHQEGDVIVADRETVSEGRFGRAMRRYLYRSDRSRISLTTGGVYNRVEGSHLSRSHSVQHAIWKISLDAPAICHCEGLNWIATVLATTSNRNSVGGTWPFVGGRLSTSSTRGRLASQGPGWARVVLPGS